MTFLRNVDPEVARAIEGELFRQRYSIELIASENFTSRAVLEAQGCLMTNKYAEGYPAKRYYGGCTYVDMVENLARERVKQLFNAEHANVQPHSGAQANMASFFAILNPKDKVMGMSLAHGGHLTHGSPVNYSGQLYDFVYYGVSSETETIDYDEVRRLAHEHKPKLILAGASAYPRIIDFEAFSSIAKEVGAYLMVDMAHIAGLVAAGLHPNPVPVSDIVTITTHKTLRGPWGGVILCKAEHAKAIDKSVFPGTQGGPLMHIIAAKAVAFKEALSNEFRDYQRQIIKNAKKMAEVLKEKGIRIVSGGTDNHLFLCDLRPLGVTGKYAQEKLEEVNIIVNKNAIPFDEQPPMVTSGIRIGTPAMTTRGMKEPEMEKIASMIYRVLTDGENEKTLMEVKLEVKELCETFPLYPGMEV